MMVSKLIIDDPNKQPILAAGLVTLSILAFVIIQYLFHITEVSSDPLLGDMRLVRCGDALSRHCIEVKQATTELALVEQRSAHMYWQAIAVSLYFEATIVFIYSLWVMLTPWKDISNRLSKPLLVFFGLVILLLVGLVLLGKLSIEIKFLSYPGPLSEFIDFANPKFGDLLRMPKNVEFAVVFLILAFASTVVRQPAMNEIEYIKLASKRLKMLLGLTSVFFITGVMISNSAFSWLVSFVDLSVFNTNTPVGAKSLSSISNTAGKAISAWVTAATFKVSIAYTLLILAAFVPPALYINRQAGLYARQQMPDSTNDERHSMLDAEGIAINWPQGLAQLLAILAPLIAGPFIKALTDSVSSL